MKLYPAKNHNGELVRTFNNSNTVRLNYLTGLNTLGKVNGLMMLLLFSILILFYSCSKEEVYPVDEEEHFDLKIFTHAAMAPILDKCLPVFEEEHDCSVVVDYTAEPRDLVPRVLQERDKNRADIVLGVDNCNLAWALSDGIAQQYKPEDLELIDRKYHFDRTNHFTPYSFAYYAFVYDTHQIEKPPESFGKMQDGIWKNNILISDPRTSTNGLGILFWSVALFGENGFGHFWRSIKNNVFFVTPLWEESFSMFLAGEAPIMFGMTTSPSYLRDTEGSDNYKTFIPVEGALRFIEGVGITEGTRNLSLAKQFVDFVISREFQQHIATKRYMYPVDETLALPASFDDIEKPELVLNDNIARLTTTRRIDNWIDRWQQIMVD